MDPRYTSLGAGIAANPAIASLRGQALADALNAPAGTVPAPMYFVELTAMVPATISAESFLKVWNHPRFDRFYNDVLTQNVYAVSSLYPSVFAMDGTLSQPEAGALAAYASRVIPGGPTVAQGIAGWEIPSVTLADLAVIGKDQ